jgi:hypothetical protein
MINEVKSKLNRTVIVEKFNSIHELINTVKERPLLPWVGQGSRNGKHDGERWVGNITFQEAINFIQFGWDKPLPEFKAAIKKLDDKKLHDAKKPVIFKSVAGFKPIVPNALKGLPKSMMGKKLVVKKAKIVNVMVELSKSASYSHSTIVEKSIEILSHLYNLERQGWRVRLSMLGTHAHPDGSEKQMGWLLPIKHENQLFDIKKLMFPLVHSAMLRLISFDWYESVPGGIEVSGYGRTTERWPDRERKAFLDVFGGDSYYVIGMETDMKQLFTKLK